MASLPVFIVFGALLAASAAGYALSLRKSGQPAIARDRARLTPAARSLF